MNQFTLPTAPELGYAYRITAPFARAFGARPMLITDLDGALTWWTRIGQDVHSGRAELKTVPVEDKWATPHARRNATPVVARILFIHSVGAQQSDQAGLESHRDALAAIPDHLDAIGLHPWFDADAVQVADDDRLFHPRTGRPLHVVRA